MDYDTQLKIGFVLSVGAFAALWVLPFSWFVVVPSWAAIGIAWWIIVKGP